MSRFAMVLAVTLTVQSPLAPLAVACPFCTAVSQTFAEEMATMEVVVIAELLSGPAELPKIGDVVDELPPSKFVVQDIIKGGELVEVGDAIQTHYFGTTEKDSVYLIMGADAPNLMWSGPLPLNERVHQYVKAVSELPEGYERLEFFQQYLEDEDEMIARDAYDEFAKTPYDGVISLRERMDRGQLLAWIQKPETPASRRRLYLTMLGVCGTEQDVPLLEELLTREERDARLGLDAMIACYLSLAGEAGLPLVEERFLDNPDSEYSETYSAIMAIRFHGNESDAISRERLTQSLQFVLKRPQLADLVIPDLARWEDWTVVEQLVGLFQQADEESNWVRVPIVNYMRACPLEEAIEAIKKLEEIDPEAVKRANIFFPFAQFSGGPRNEDEPEESAAQGGAQPVPPPEVPAGEG